MSKYEIINPELDSMTRYDIDNLIGNVFVYHFHLLGEALFGFLMQNLLLKNARRVETFAIYHSQLYFQQIHIIIYKLILDNSGKSSINFQKLLNLILKKNFKPEIESEIKNIRTDFNSEIIKKYNDLLEHMRIFRTKSNAHIVAVPIEAKTHLKADSDSYSGEIIPMIQDFFKQYIRLLDLYKIKHDLYQYTDINELIKKRMSFVI